MYCFQFDLVINIMNFGTTSQLVSNPKPLLLGAVAVLLITGLASPVYPPLPLHGACPPAGVRCQEQRVMLALRGFVIKDVRGTRAPCTAWRAACGQVSSASGCSSRLRAGEQLGSKLLSPEAASILAQPFHGSVKGK